MSDHGAAQSCQRYGLRSAGENSAPSASACSASRASCASRMRRNRIQVSYGTYCKALWQLERRITSQMPFTNADSDWVLAIALADFAALAAFCFLGVLATAVTQRFP